MEPVDALNPGLYTSVSLPLSSLPKASTASSTSSVLVGPLSAHWQSHKQLDEAAIGATAGECHHGGRGKSPANQPPSACPGIVAMPIIASSFTALSLILETSAGKRSAHVDHIGTSVSGLRRANFNSISYCPSRNAITLTVSIRTSKSSTSELFFT